MIFHSFLTVFNLDEDIVALHNLYRLTANDTLWYYQEHCCIVDRLCKELEDDLEKCDPHVTRVCLDHVSWMQCDFGTSDTGVLISRTWEVKQKIQKILADTVARYPQRLREFHDDLRQDGVETPEDI